MLGLPMRKTRKSLRNFIHTFESSSHLCVCFLPHFLDSLEGKQSKTYLNTESKATLLLFPEPKPDFVGEHLTVT